MAANTSPIYTKVANVGGATLSAANAATDGTGALGTTIFLVYEERDGNADGSYVNEYRVKQLGDVSTATVLRLFYNNGDTIAVAANNSLVREIPIAQKNLVDAVEYTWLPDNGQLPPGYRVYASINDEISDGIRVTAIGGDY